MNLQRYKWIVLPANEQGNFIFEKGDLLCFNFFIFKKIQESFLIFNFFLFLKRFENTKICIFDYNNYYIKL